MRRLSKLRNARDVADFIESNYDWVERLVNSGDQSYRCYRSQLLNRDIEEPSSDLKLVQRALLYHFGKTAKPHKAAHGGVKGRSTLSNVQVHHPARSVSKLDIRRFFPSVSVGLVRNALGRYGLAGEALETVVGLTTYAGRLPTGAPTSPWLGNLVLWTLDKQMTSICGNLGVRYSRYVDDLTLSGKRSPEAFGAAHYHLKRLGFKSSLKKSRRECDPGKPIVITGYVVNQECIEPAPEYKQKIASLVERFLAAHERQERITSAELSQLFGHLAYLRATCPDETRTYVERLLAVGLVQPGSKLSFSWPDEEEELPDLDEICEYPFVNELSV